MSALTPRTLGSTRLWVWSATVGAATVAVLAVGLAAGWTPLLRLDTAVDVAAHRELLTQPWLLTCARITTTLGSPLVVDLVTAAAGIVMLFAHRWAAMIFLVVARLGELGCETALKAVLARPRPALPNPFATAADYSFPSGHAAGSAVVYTAVALLVLPLLRRWAQVLLGAVVALLIAAVAASRVLLGVHYPSDITAGVALGLAWVGAAALLTTRLAARRSVRRARGSSSRPPP